jgi:hypothetical protein
MSSRLLKKLSRANVARLTVAAILLGSLQVVAVALPAVSNADGTGSILFVKDASNLQYLRIPASANYQYAGDFTVEAWFKFTTLPNYQVLLGQNVSGSSWFLQMMTNQMRLFRSGQSDITSSVRFVTNKWYHIALVRNGTASGNVRIYVNGVSTAEGSITGNFGLSANDGQIGGGKSDNGNVINGRVSNIRYSKKARYTSNFSPETSKLFDIDSDTVLQLNTTNDANFLKDSSDNNASITAYNGVSTSTGLPVADAEAPVFSIGDLAKLDLNAGDINSYSKTGNSWVNLGRGGSTFDATLNGRTFTDSGTASYFSFSAQSGGTIPLPVTLNMTWGIWLKSVDISRSCDGNNWYNGSPIIGGELGGDVTDFGLYMCRGNLVFGIGASDLTVRTSNTYSDGAWHYFSVTRNSTNGQIRLYVDGVLDGSSDSAGNGARTPSTLGIAYNPADSFKWTGNPNVCIGIHAAIFLFVFLL